MEPLHYGIMVLWYMVLQYYGTKVYGTTVKPDLV